MTIERTKRGLRYYDMNNVPIKEGDTVLMDGRKMIVYKVGAELGTDATKQEWLDTGRAVPCEYGVYPFTTSDEPVIVK